MFLSSLKFFGVLLLLIFINVPFFSKQRRCCGSCIIMCLFFLLLVVLVMAALCLYHPPAREQLRQFYSLLERRMEDYMIQTASAQHGSCVRPVWPEKETSKTKNVLDICLYLFCIYVSQNLYILNVFLSSSITYMLFLYFLYIYALNICMNLYTLYNHIEHFGLLFLVLCITILQVVSEIYMSIVKRKHNDV